MREQSSGCSACDQLGQTPTPEHLEAVARLEARVQAATGGHRQNDEYPAFCRCLSRWPCELAADELAAEVTRLRERVAALEGAVEKAADWHSLPPHEFEGRWGRSWEDSPDADGLIASDLRAALAGQEQAGGAG